MSEPTAGFVAGFTARHALAAQALQRAFAVPTDGFRAADPRPRAAAPTGFAAQPSGPRHFSPADPNSDPTAGWDPLDPGQPIETPFVDPVSAAHSAGYAEGLAAGMAHVANAGERDRAMLAALAEQLGGAARINREEIAARLRRTVMTLVTRLVGEVGVSSERLAQRIAAAAELLSDAAESALLRVHPDDVALLDGRLPATIFAAGDATLQRGHFVLESASTVVEDGPALWLDQLAETIDRIAVPEPGEPQEGVPC